MFRQNLYLDAIESVLARGLPGTAFVDAVNDQVSLMAGFNPEDGCKPD